MKFWGIVQTCLAVLINGNILAAEWQLPVSHVDGFESGWVTGSSQKITWVFDRCNDGQVVARNVIDDSRPGGDGACVEIVCKGSERRRLYFRNKTNLNIPQGTTWIAVWMKGVKGRAERLDGTTHFLDSRGLLNGSALSFARPITIKDDGQWKQYVFLVPEIKSGTKSWGFDEASKSREIAWPLQVTAWGWELQQDALTFRMDDWTAGTGEHPKTDLVFQLDTAKPRSLSPKETAETWFNGWINRDPDLVMLYYIGRIPFGENTKRAEAKVERFYSRLFPLLMSDKFHARGIKEIEVYNEKKHKKQRSVNVRVVIEPSPNGWVKSNGEFDTQWWSMGGSPWYLNGGF